MKLDLRSFVTPILKQIERRVREYDPVRNSGPGAPGDPIQQIVLGFQFDQSAWVSLVFDTRRDADPVYDGVWQSYIEPNMLECDVESWIAAYEELIEKRKQVTLIGVDGSDVKIDPCVHDDYEDEYDAAEQLAELFGSVCRDALLNAQASSLFSSLPLAKTACVRVDEHECQYAWPDYDSRGGDDDEGRILHT